MRVLQADMKEKHFRRVYLLYGTESYLVQQFRKQMIQAINGGDTMNTMISEEGTPDRRQVEGFLQTFPMFADHRLAVLSDTNLFDKASDGWDELIKNIPETAVLIFVEKKVDKRLALYKALTKLPEAQVHLAEFNAPDERTLQMWVVKKLKDAGKKMNQQVYDELVRREGESMDNLACELEKLIAFSGEREVITMEDIRAICSPHPVDQVFMMIDAVLDGQQERAMQLYYDLLAMREPAAKILALLGRQTNQLFLARTLADDGPSMVASALKVQPFVAKKLLQKCGRMDGQQLQHMVELCVEHEYLVKSGQMEDTLAVERLIVMLSHRR